MRETLREALSLARPSVHLSASRLSGNFGPVTQPQAGGADRRTAFQVWTSTSGSL